MPCTVVVPEGNNPEINRIVESFGADLIVHGKDFYDAQSYCDELVDSAGYYYVEQGNEPEILNGLGTMGLEIFEDLPDVDVIICPIGGGSGCASLVKVAQAVNPEVEIIGVQAERAAAFYESWKKGERVTIDGADTVADGLAARSVFQLPYVIMKDHITDVVLLDRRRDPRGHPPGPGDHAQPGRRRRRGVASPRRSRSRTGWPARRWRSSCRAATWTTSTCCRRSPSASGRGAAGRPRSTCKYASSALTPGPDRAGAGLRLSTCRVLQKLSAEPCARTATLLVGDADPSRTAPTPSGVQAGPRDPCACLAALAALSHTA